MKKITETGCNVRVHLSPPMLRLQKMVRSPRMLSPTLFTQTWESVTLGEITK